MMERYDAELRKKLSSRARLLEIYRAALQHESWHYEYVLHSPVALKQVAQAGTAAIVQVKEWVAFWRELAQDWEVETSDKRVAGLGVQHAFPVRVTIPSAEAALTYLGERRHFETFAARVRPLLVTFPCLESVCLQPKVRELMLQEAGLAAALGEVAAYLISGYRTDCYLRELDIPHVDTKFIERHQDPVARVFAALHPESGVSDFRTLCTQLQWRIRPEEPHIYLRSLDPALTFAGMQSCMATPMQLAALHLPVERVFVTENKVNGTVFPTVKDALVLYGAGNSITGNSSTGSRITGSMDDVTWLHTLKELYYWGDLDRDGFTMLARFRRQFPQAQSLLMDEATATACQDFAVPDDGTAIAEPPAELTAAERAGWLYLQGQPPAHRRIEQEKVPMHLLTAWLQQHDLHV